MYYMYYKIAVVNRVRYAVQVMLAGMVLFTSQWAYGADEEEVVVTGIRESLKNALDLKRDSVGVVDGIVAEDIAKFPDLNIGEALQRVPGVTLERGWFSNGEGKRISVRGLPSDFIQTTLNGTTAASSATDGSNIVRAFDFDLFASELFSAATVYKSSSADIAEGGLSGTVDLRTPRAFDYNERQFVVSVKGQDAELSNDDGGVDPRLAVLFADTFMDDQLGVTFSYAYSDTYIRADWIEGWGWGNTGRAFLMNTINGADRMSGTSDDLDQAGIDGFGTTVNGQPATLAQLNDIADNTITTLLPRMGPNTSNRESNGVTFGFQFRPNDDVEIAADVLYATFDETQYRATIDGLTGFGRRGVEPKSLIVSNGVLIAGTLDNITQRTESVEELYENEFLHMTLEGGWDIRENWALSGKLSHSAAETDELRRTYLFQHTGEFNFDLRDPKAPVISGTDFDYLDPDDYEPGQFRFRPRQREDEQTSLQVDLERVFDNGALASIEGGFRYADKEASQKQAEQRGGFGENSLDFDDYAQEVSDVAPGFRSHDAGGTPTNFLIVNQNAGAAFLPTSLRSSVFNDYGRPLSTWTVKEKTTAAYLKSLWKPSWGDIDAGLRVVRTELESSGFNLAGGDPKPTSSDNSYTDVLPNLNIKTYLEEDLIFRFSANKTISRPTLVDLSPGINFSPTVLTGNGGNPDLDPFRANQYDLSLEWYFDSESLFSITYFQKNIDSFISDEITTETYKRSTVGVGDSAPDAGTEPAEYAAYLDEDVDVDVTRPVNGDDGEVSGLELSYQRPFGDSGFGMLANATFARSEGTVSGKRRDLIGFSDLSYNLVGYYEKYGFSARLAFSHRSDYVEAYRGADGNDIVDDRNQLDLALGYDINEQFSVNFDALNVTGEDYYRYRNNRAVNSRLLEQEPVYVLGIRYKL